MARKHSSRSRVQKVGVTKASTSDGDDDEPTPSSKKYTGRVSATARKPTTTTSGKKPIIDTGSSSPRATRASAAKIGRAVKMETERKKKVVNKKRKNVKDKEVISEERWQGMRAYGSFIVNHPKDEDEEYRFSKEDIVAVLPYGRSPNELLEPWEYWIAKIKDVRAEIHNDGVEEHNTVYVKVQWFYSGKDVGDVVKSFDANTISTYERIFSDHYDILEPQTIDGIIPIAKYDESDPEPAYIPRDRFFRRYTLEYKLRSVQPKPRLCACNRAYNPMDRSPGSLMHFCPRPSCRRAHHARCLGSSKESSGVKVDISGPAGGSPKETPRKSARKHASPVKKARMRGRANGETSVVGLTPRALRLLACSPDTDEDMDLAGLIPRRHEHDEEGRRAIDDAEMTGGKDDSDAIRLERPRKRQRAASPSSTAAKTPAPTLSQLLSAVPPDLLAVATQPQMRGGAFWEGGVSGNVGFVTRARRLVYQYLRTGDGGVLNGWEETVFGSPQEGQEEDEAGVSEERGQAQKGKAKRNARGEVGKRPTIENAIVRVDGWNVEPFVCPECRSAI